MFYFSRKNLPHSTGKIDSKLKNNLSNVLTLNEVSLCFVTNFKSHGNYLHILRVIFVCYPTNIYTHQLTSALTHCRGLRIEEIRIHIVEKGHVQFLLLSLLVDVRMNLLYLLRTSCSQIECYYFSVCIVIKRERKISGNSIEKNLQFFSIKSKKKFVFNY